MRLWFVRKDIMGWMTMICLGAVTVVVVTLVSIRKMPNGVRRKDGKFVKARVNGMLNIKDELLETLENTDEKR